MPLSFTILVSTNLPASAGSYSVKPTAEELNRLDKLQAGVDAAAKSARTNYLFFLTILGYFLILVLRTSHEDMFKQSDLLLPGLGIGVGIVEFYFIAPIFIGLLHVNVLIHYYLLAKRAFAYEVELSKLPDEDWRRHLTYPFLLSDLLLGRHLPRAVRALIAIFLYVNELVIPGLALLYAQAHFVPFHSVGVTTANQWTVFIDGTAEFLLMVMFLKDWFRLKKTKLYLIAEIIVLFGSLVSVLLVSVISYNLVVPDENPKCEIVDSLEINEFKIMAQNYSRPDFFDCLKFDDKYIFPRALNLFGKTLVAKEPPPELIAQYMLQGKSAKDAIIDHAEGLQLKDKRDLRWANLIDAKIPRLIANNAQLQGADLLGAELQGANFSSAKLSLSDFRNTDLMRLSAEKFEELKKLLPDNEAYLKRLERAREGKLSLPKEKFPGLLADPGSSFAQLVEPLSEKERAKRRVQLACTDKFIAQGIAKQRHSKLEAQALLDEDCPAISQLPANLRETLQETANRPN
jgi:hypothetical protein